MEIKEKRRKYNIICNKEELDHILENINCNKYSVYLEFSTYLDLVSNKYNEYKIKAKIKEKKAENIIDKIIPTLMEYKLK